MPFDDLMNDIVKVLKQDGVIISDIKSSVQKDKIFIQRSDILIETGDLIQRSMSNGAEETYKVIDPGFHEKFHGIPAGYQMDVIKLGLPEAKAACRRLDGRRGRRLPHRRRPSPAGCLLFAEFRRVRTDLRQQPQRHPLQPSLPGYHT